MNLKFLHSKFLFKKKKKECINTLYKSTLISRKEKRDKSVTGRKLIAGSAAGGN